MPAEVIRYTILVPFAIIGNVNIQNLEVTKSVFIREGFLCQELKNAYLKVIPAFRTIIFSQVCLLYTDFESFQKRIK